MGDKDTNLQSIEDAYNDNKEVNNERTSRIAFLDSNLKYHTPDYSASSGVGVIDSQCIGTSNMLAMLSM